MIKEKIESKHTDLKLEWFNNLDINKQKKLTMVEFDSWSWREEIVMGLLYARAVYEVIFKRDGNNAERSERPKGGKREARFKTLKGVG